MDSSPRRRLTPLAVTLVLGLGTLSTACTPVLALPSANAPAAAKANPARSAPKWTAADLYKSGKLPSSGCTPGELTPGSMRAYTRFLTRLTDCLNRSWGRQFKKAGIPFAKPKLKIIAARQKTPCGAWPVGVDGLYCSGNSTMYMLINKNELRNPFPVGIGRLMAHEYGHHVQALTGILHKYDVSGLTTRKALRLENSRRLELQAECLSSAFMRASRDTLPVSSESWVSVLDYFRDHGDKLFPQNDHGKGATQVFWMKRGWNYAAPAACDTWSVGARYVS